MEGTEQAQIPEVADQAVDNHGKSPKESFAELRKAKEDLERQLWQVHKEREIEKNMQLQAQQMQKVHIPPEEDFDYRNLENEEYPDGKKIVKAFSSLNKKLSDYDKQLKEKEQKLLLLEAATEFDDFKQVVTPGNIEKYINSDEDNRELVQRAANPLRKVYHLIKKSAAYHQDNATPTVQKTASVSQEQQRVNDKESKPKTGSHGVRSEAVSIAAQVSNSKMSREQKNAIWAETTRAASTNRR